MVVQTMMSLLETKVEAGVACDSIYHISGKVHRLKVSHYLKVGRSRVISILKTGSPLTFSPLVGVGGGKQETSQAFN